MAQDEAASREMVARCVNKAADIFRYLSERIENLENEAVLQGCNVLDVLRSEPEYFSRFFRLMKELKYDWGVADKYLRDHIPYGAILEKLPQIEGTMQSIAEGLNACVSINNIPRSQRLMDLWHSEWNQEEALNAIVLLFFHDRIDRCLRDTDKLIDKDKLKHEEAVLLVDLSV